jgi:hypothetical protein
MVLKVVVVAMGGEVRMEDVEEGWQQIKYIVLCVQEACMLTAILS